MRKINFKKTPTEDGNTLCEFMIPSRCYETTTCLIYNGDLVIERILPPEDKDIYVWLTHSFLKHYPGGEIKIFENYFGTKGEEETDLFFVHPTKCGGSSIEQTGYEYGIRWGRWRKVKFHYHRPSQYFMNEPNLIENKVLFTSVRNPYDRLISAVNCPYIKVEENRANHELDVDTFNHHLKNRIKKEYTLYDFVYHNGKKVVPHVLKQENLTNDFNKLMFDYNCDARMEKKHNSSDNYTKTKKFTIEHINKENMNLLNTKFRLDFEYFDYNMVTW